ncbi:MAG: ABC transporter substrate-binding protein [Alphaproteobacteria bacterium]|nr:ABC transporter substrate-binding protein [Alphaproteobacteria bacterium]
MIKLNVLIAAVIVVALPATLAHAQSGIFRQSHDVGFGAGVIDVDPSSGTRFWQVTEKTMSRLVRPGTSGEPEPNLATEWSANDDATEWTFKLRGGVKFHDGSDFDAGDVVYSLEHVRDPERDSPAASVIAMVDKIEAVDPLTVKMTLSAPYADLPLQLMDYRIRMIPEGSANKHHKTLRSEIDEWRSEGLIDAGLADRLRKRYVTIETTGIGTGPFILEKLDPEGTTILKANPDYWEGPPGVETVEIIGIADAQARVQALLSGQIDTLGYGDLSGQQLPLFENNPKFKVQSVATGDWLGIVFRTDTEPFTDARVRKALRLPTDRQALVDLVLGPGGGVVTCDHPVWTGDQYRAPFECPQQIDEAKRLLAEAGYPDGIEFDITTSDLDPRFITLAEAYQQQVKKAGIKVNIVMAPADGYWSDTWMKKPVVTTRWGQRPADQILNEDYRGGAPWNETYWNRPDFDKLLDQARQELDFEKRTALYHRLQEILYEEGGSFIPFHVNQYVVSTAKVSGLQAVFADAVRYHLVHVSD